jgi:hypothetical protein
LTNISQQANSLNNLEPEYVNQGVSIELVTDTTKMNSMMAINFPFPWETPSTTFVPVTPLVKSRVKKYTLMVDVFSILDMRLAEGFKLVNIRKETGELGTVSQFN